MSTSIAFGICTSNDGTTISSLLQQCFAIAKEYANMGSDVIVNEIIIISSGSTDTTNGVLQKIQNKLNQVKNLEVIIEKDRKGKTHAVNQILGIYKSDFVIFIPADVSITFSTVHSLVTKIIQDPIIGVVSGRPVPNLVKVKSKKLKNLLETIWELHNQTLKLTSISESNSHSSGELMILRKDIVESLPPEIINDDAYMAAKTKSLGYKVDFESKAIVKIEVPITFRDYIIQRKRVLAGHKQLAERLQKTSTNFRTLLSSRPLTALKIMKQTLTSSSRIAGFLLAIIVELRVELELSIENLVNKNKGPSNNSVWTRINQGNGRMAGD